MKKLIIFVYDIIRKRFTFGNRIERNSEKSDAGYALLSDYGKYVFGVKFGFDFAVVKGIGFAV